MIQTMKRVINVSGVKIGLASVHDETGKAFLQAAILHGNQHPIASTSLYFPATSILTAENKLKSISDNELEKIIGRIDSYDSFANRLSKALSNTQTTHQASTTQTTHHQQPVVRPSYKRAVN